MKKDRLEAGLGETLEQTFDLLQQIMDREEPLPEMREVGRVHYVGRSTVLVKGLPGARSEELISFAGGHLGMAFNVDQDLVGVVLLDESRDISAGSVARRTGRVVETPVGEGLIGRMIDPLGRVLDKGGRVQAAEFRQVERDAPAIMERAPVTVPLQSGVKAVDALIPIGRGQRELILGDRQTGKTQIALDTIINQKGQGVICIYCSIGQRSSATAKAVDALRQAGAMDYTVVVVAEGDAQAGLQFIAPYAATAMGEYFMEQGRDVLVVYDDLSRHAVAYREVSLLLRRPPGREAFPGDIFYIHSRLLERSTHLKEDLGGGSLTALPIVETEAQNISAYIPTNLISITDGQIYLSPNLFQKGIMPAVDIGKSVSRVGGKTQLPAYRAVAGDLRLSYSQFEELEAFSRFGTRLDEATRQTLERGYRVREVLKQPPYAPIPVPEQIAQLLAVTEGVFDDVPLSRMGEARQKVRQAMRGEVRDIKQRIMDGQKLSDEDKETLTELLRHAVRELTGPGFQSGGGTA